jgi:hypothetical protein
MTPHAVTCVLGIYDQIYDQMYLEDGDFYSRGGAGISGYDSLIINHSIKLNY